MEKSKVRRIVIAIAVFLVAMIGIFGVTFVIRVNDFYEDNYMQVNLESEEFVETADELNNPFVGFYGLVHYSITDDLLGDSLNTRLTLDYAEVAMKKYDDQLLVELNLQDYLDREMTPNAVAAVDTILKFWKEHGYTMIVRFLYDWDGQALEHEPESVELVKKHMEACAKAVNFHQDAILTMQGVYLGNWGEMHGSKFLTPENIRELMEYQCEVFDPNIYMAVRTPAQRRSVLESAEDIPVDKAYGESIEARLGLFDDGMMSSESDVGTFGEASFKDIKDDYTLQLCRDDELEYQSRISKYVPNGGEICYDTEYNDIKNAIKTLRQMKITYLNAGPAYDKWSAKNVKTEDAFNGMNALDYIQRHLGYRYHISSVGTDFYCYGTDTLDINIGITNTGFAPLYKPVSARVHVVDPATGEGVYSCWIEDIDLRMLDTTEEAIGVARIPKNQLPSGEYSVYIKYFFNYGEKMLNMANDIEVDPERGYKLCNFTIDREAPSAKFSEKMSIYKQYGGL